MEPTCCCRMLHTCSSAAQCSVLNTAMQQHSHNCEDRIVADSSTSGISRFVILPREQRLIQAALFKLSGTWPGKNIPSIIFQVFTIPSGATVEVSGHRLVQGQAPELFSMTSHQPPSLLVCLHKMKISLLGPVNRLCNQIIRAARPK